MENNRNCVARTKQKSVSKNIALTVAVAAVVFTTTSGRHKHSFYKLMRLYTYSMTKSFSLCKGYMLTRNIVDISPVVDSTFDSDNRFRSPGAS